MINRVKTLFAATLVFLLAPAVLGQDSTSVKAVKTYRHGLQVKPLDPIFGKYTMGYEFLINQRHGLYFEGSLMDSPHSLGNIVTFGYWRHREGRMGGKFWGPFLKIADYEAEVKEKTDEGTFWRRYSIESVAIGLCTGKRWLYKSGFSIVFRVGYGYPFVDFKWKGPKPEEGAGLIEGMLWIMEGLSGELSIGWSF